MNKVRCTWCLGETDGYNLDFCSGIHRKYYENFRAGFKTEMFELKTKPKVSDTEKYKMIRNYLTSSKTRFKTVMPDF